MSIAQPVAAELEQEAKATRRVLERVPSEHLGWQPHPKSMSLGQLAMHVATIPGNIARMARQDGFDVATAKFSPPVAEKAEDLIPALDAGLAEARALLDGLDEASANAPWRFTHGEREIFTQPRLGVVRSLMLNHWYHHRGQLVVYLRLLDVPVPSVYGPSADDNPFAGAVQV